MRNTNTQLQANSLEPRGFEPRIQPCHGRVMPFHYGPECLLGMAFASAEEVKLYQLAGESQGMRKCPCVYATMGCRGFPRFGRASCGVGGVTGNAAITWSISSWLAGGKAKVPSSA